MALTTSPETAEAFLLSRLRDIQEEIAKLENERSIVLKQLQHARTRSARLHDVTRKNSYTRILTENRVLELVKATNSSLATRVLVKKIQELHPQMKDVTARSHLVRMREKGMIRSAGHGLWASVGPN